MPTLSWKTKSLQVSTSPPPRASLSPPAVVVTNWTLDIDEWVIHPWDELHAPLVWLSLGMQRTRKGPACWSSRCASIGIAIVVRIYSPIFSHLFLITGHFLCLQDLPRGLDQMIFSLFQVLNMVGLPCHFARSLLLDERRSSRTFWPGWNCLSYQIFWLFLATSRLTSWTLRVLGSLFIIAEGKWKRNFRFLYLVQYKSQKIATIVVKGLQRRMIALAIGRVLVVLPCLCLCISNRTMQLPSTSLPTMPGPRK